MFLRCVRPCDGLVPANARGGPPLLPSPNLRTANDRFKPASTSGRTTA
jgi:hypothetical protein